MKGKLMIKCFFCFAFGLISITFYTLIVEYASCYEPGLGIISSPHDLSIATGQGAIYGQTDSMDRICIFCHAPHHAIEEGDAADIKYLPLWNHEVTTQFYTTYQSDFGDGPTSSGFEGAGEAENANQFIDRHLFNAEDSIGQPGSNSRLCQSCHDGTVAVNAYGFAPSESIGAADVFMKGLFEIGGNGNLTNHHPIGFDYAQSRANDDEIVNEQQQFGSSSISIASVLENGRVECITCHDVHNTKNEGETLLWSSDQNSKFCCTCHIKCE